MSGNAHDDAALPSDIDGGVPRPDADPLAPDANPLAPDANPLAPDANPLPPDAHVASPDADIASPDAHVASPDADIPLPDGGIPTTTWTELGPSTLSLAGGAAPTVSGHGQPGGQLHLVAQGAITLDKTAIAPAAPPIPAQPAGALRPTSLGADVDAPGAVVIAGLVASTGTDAVRTIRAGGDIFIAGTLRGGDLGARRQAVRLTTGGTVYVTAGGSIDTRGGAPNQAGGGIEIVARRVVIIGGLAADGSGGSEHGAAAGDVSLRVTDEVFIGGTIDARGGDGRGAGAVVGGAGGTLSVQVGGALLAVGNVRLRGGAATSTAGAAQGGAAGNTVVSSDSNVTIGGVLDARGGIARSDLATAVVAGGAAGTLRVGETAAPTAILVHADTDVSGGDGGQAAGNGGTVLFQPRAGDLRVISNLLVNGGDSAHSPGAGGHIEGHPGPDTAAVTTAGVYVAGEVAASGGSMLPGSSGNGGAGGLVKLVNLSTMGAMTVTQAGVVRVDGGTSTGAGTGGAGGMAYLFTQDGNASIGGQLLARGGNAPGPSGTGGIGGFLYVFTDDNHGGPGPGILVIETTGIVDASGGSGATGGSGRNCGHVGQVASWPVSQTDEYDVQQIAVLLNSDGVHGGATGWLENHGLVRTRGSHTNGSGGDVFFHGKAASGDAVPVPGRIDDAGDGTGTPGTFGGKHIIIIGPTI